MDYIALTTHRYLFTEAETRTRASKNFQELRVSGEWVVWMTEKLIIKKEIEMDTEFKNEDRSRYYGLRIGDTVNAKNPTGDICATSDVIGFSVDDNNKVYINNKDGKTIDWVAEWCDIVTKVEDKTALLKVLTEAEKKEISESKRIPWGDLGVKISTEDFKFQARAQEAIATLIIPTKIEEVAKAETLLKNVKAKGVSISNDRKEITRPVDNRLTELMLAEKSFEEPCKKVEVACIALKKADKERVLNENLKLDALKNCRVWLTTTRNDADAAFKTINIEKVSKAYEYALGVGEIGLDMVEGLIDLAIGKRNAVEFDFIFPKNIYPLVTPEEFQEMCMELLVFDANVYITDYKDQLTLKFSNYAVALTNKAQALVTSKKETETKSAEIASSATQQNVTVKVKSVPITPVVSSGVKALKQVWVVDMPETVESVGKIMSAFFGNIDMCLSELSVSKWFSLTPSQVSVALAKVKNKDEVFSPEGITFKQEDKLK